MAPIVYRLIGNFFDHPFFFFSIEIFAIHAKYSGSVSNGLISLLKLFTSLLSSISEDIFSFNYSSCDKSQFPSIKHHSKNISLQYLCHRRLNSFWFFLIANSLSHLYRLLRNLNKLISIYPIFLLNSHRYILYWYWTAIVIS